jgi:DNA-binding response OmpR family regulator
MRVLIVEDEHKIANSIKKGLQQESYAVDVSYDGNDGFDMATSEEYDIVVLDLMLPGMDGLTICKKLRNEGNHTPILILTAKGLVEDKVEGLNSGADDYLAKPFAFSELLARIKALSRRPKHTTGNILTVSDLTLNPITYEVRRNGGSIDLSKTEYSLLEYMMAHKDKVLTKDQLINHVWNYDADILSNTVEVYIGYLRNKIDKPFPESKQLIKTVRGFGYKISE